jgi:hypothetical protein
MAVTRYFRVAPAGPWYRGTRSTDRAGGFRVGPEEAAAKLAAELGVGGIVALDLDSAIDDPRPPDGPWAPVPESPEPAPERTVDELIAADPGELTPREIARLAQAAARRMPAP